MEGLAPPLEALIHLKFGLESGVSVRTAIQKYAETRSEFSQHLNLLVSHYDKQRSLLDFKRKEPSGSVYRSAVVDVVIAALSGQPVLERIQALELEVMQAAQAEIDTYIKVLPYKLMVPLFLFQVPAFLLLLLGPILLSVLKSIGE